MAYYRVSPFGDERADLRMGILASLLANVYRKKGVKAFAPRDFMPFVEKARDNAQALSRRLRAAFTKK